ncbi:hypothetical protein B0H15DRAFT_1026205 [Mycena belliarum]|uniref:Uncharacterized protein n=1 Tax=Mycena belliarum TaxID=1033014 RepID=A0AAD6XGK8_9AGAR|nr:hypothetical protein B0H15DRAFT_1026205 [Mycena belliae]
MSNHPVTIPTPDAPFISLYPTHRITAKFDQLEAMLEHDYRLSESPRTRPIRGLTSRRLLALGHEWADLTRYSEMDMKALRDYDLVLLAQSQGAGVYPWVPTHPIVAPPAPEQREALLQQLKPKIQKWDARCAAEEAWRCVDEESGNPSACQSKDGVHTQCALVAVTESTQKDRSAKDGACVAGRQRRKGSPTDDAKPSAVTAPENPRKRRLQGLSSTSQKKQCLVHEMEKGRSTFYSPDHLMLSLRIHL